MQLTILGSGGGTPSLKRSSPANLLKIKNKNILVDCGSGTIHQLLKTKIGYKNIDMVFLTHFHVDHSCDINALIFALKWTPDYFRKKDLFLIGPVGLKKLCRNGYFRIKTKKNTFKVKLFEIKKSLKFSDFTVNCIKTKHAKESIAYKFTEKNKSLVITGDCDYSKELINFPKKDDVLLIECSASNKMKIKNHLIPKECGEIAKNAGVKKMILTHLLPPMYTEKKRLSEAKKIFKNTILAEDLMKINL